MDENPVPSYIAIFKQDLLIISRKKVDRFFFFLNTFSVMAAWALVWPGKKMFLFYTEKLFYSCRATQFQQIYLSVSFFQQ